MSEQNIPNRFYSGLSGIVLPVPKYKYPEAFQQSSRLTYYASQFNSIEVNSSFYALPRAVTVAKWAAQVPEKFRFTFKLWKQITHVKSLQFEKSDVQQFLDVINNVGDKKACVLVQFPASFKSHHMTELEHLLDVIQNSNIGNAWDIAIEFRDPSWYCESMYELVDAYRCTIVRHDKSKAPSPYLTVNADTIYVRFHGPKGDYSGTYDDSFLSEYASYIRDWLGEGKSVFVYFNNTRGDAFNNLQKLNSFLLLSLPNTL